MLNTIPKYFFLLIFFLLALTRGASLSEVDLRRAAASWLSGSEIFHRESPSAEVESLEQIFSAVQEALPLYVLHLHPSGYLVLTGDDRLPPVLAFSAESPAGNIPQRRASPFLALLRLQGERYQQLLAEPQTRSEYHQKNLESWQRLLSVAVRADPLEDPDEIVVAPMIEQPWGQDWPYNLYLPRSAEEIPAVTGCEPTAVALIMNFHQWPPRGKGSKNLARIANFEYNVGGALYADFSLPYEWDRMMDSYRVLQSPPAVSELAVARLMFELGVAFESFFDTTGTGTFSDKPVIAMETYFGYAGLIQGESRSQATLFQRIKADVIAGFPVHASIPRHSFVVSGLAKAKKGTADYYYLNYGWDGYLSGWYHLDDGDEGTVVYSAITHFLPAKQAIFREIPFEQTRNFSLSWEFPRIHVSEAFRLSVKRNGNTTVISAETPGTALELPLSNQPLGLAEYFIEAKVGGIWQAKSDSLAVKVVEEPALVPELELEQDLFFLRQDGTALVPLLLKDPEDTLSVSCSRPDLYPADQIRISGDGARREIRLIPADNITGNAMLRLTAQNPHGVKYTRTVSILWDGLNWLENFEAAKTLAADEGKKIFLVIGGDEDWFSAELRHVFCEISDIRAKLQKEYILCYLRFPEQVQKLFGNGSFALPLTAILQYDQGVWESTFRNNPKTDEQLSPDDLRNILGVEPLQVQPSVQDVSYQAQSVFVRVVTDGAWTISNSDFLQPVRSSGSGMATVECTLLENAGEQERVAELTVSSGGFESTCQILQRGRILLGVAFAVSEKEYDGTVLAVFDGNPTVNGIASGHDVQVDFSGVRLEFSDAEPGVDKAVRLFGAVLSGHDADLYQLPAEITSVGTILPNQTSIPAGWNTITLLLQPDAESLQRWMAELQVFEYQKRSFVRAGVPQAGNTYVIFNRSGAKLELSGKKWLGGQGALPETPGWSLQSITEKTGLPPGMQAWLLEEGKYLRITDELESGKAYWLHP